MQSLVGIVPAAGQGSRLRPFTYPKELMPIAYEAAEHGEARPVLVIERSIEALRRAGATRAVVVIAPHKTEIVRYLGDGRGLGLPLAYAVQPEPRGLADAILRAAEWAPDRPLALVLPDALFEPRDAVLRTRQTLAATGADLALGVFPTETPALFAPVHSAADGTVARVEEKPSASWVMNTWGTAVWTPRFTAFLRDWARDADADDASVSLAFDAAVQAGLSVRAAAFAEGSYRDLGTRAGLAAALWPDRERPAQR